MQKKHVLLSKEEMELIVKGLGAYCDMMQKEMSLNEKHFLVGLNNRLVNLKHRQHGYPQEGQPSPDL